MKRLIAHIVLLIIILGVLPAVAGDNTNSNVSYTEVRKTYLVVMSNTNTGNRVFTYVYHEVYDMQMCYDIIKNSRVDIPTGGDAEASIAMYCTKDKGKILSHEEMTD